MRKRRSLTPSLGVPVTKDGVHLMRRAGTRREVTERIALRVTRREPAPGETSDRASDTAPEGASAASAGASDGSFDGWALNVSRGGVRCILEEKVALGAEYDVTIGVEGDSPLTRRGRIVWVQEEADGSIVGIEFLSLSGMHKAVSGVPVPAPVSSPDLLTAEGLPPGVLASEPLPSDLLADVPKPAPAHCVAPAGARPTVAPALSALSSKPDKPSPK